MRDGACGNDIRAKLPAGHGDAGYLGAHRHDRRHRRLKNTIIRRVDRRMKALQIGTVDQYVQVLERDPEEIDHLFKDLLIGVTHFFRDAKAFETVGREVIRSFLRARAPTARFAYALSDAQPEKKRITLKVPPAKSD